MFPRVANSFATERATEMPCSRCSRALDSSFDLWGRSQDLSSRARARSAASQGRGQVCKTEGIECGVPLGGVGFSVGDGWCVCSAVAHALSKACDSVGVLSFFAELVAGETPVGAVARAGGLDVG